MENFCAGDVFRIEFLVVREEEPGMVLARIWNIIDVDYTKIDVREFCKLFGTVGREAIIHVRPRQYNFMDSYFFDVMLGPDGLLYEVINCTR